MGNWCKGKDGEKKEADTEAAAEAAAAADEKKKCLEVNGGSGDGFFPAAPAYEAKTTV
jgi:hypothetical protein